MNHGKLSIAALTLATMLTACNSGSKNQNSDEWVIKNDVWKVEDIDFDEIAEVVDIKPIVSDEPIDDISYIKGVSNDFITSGSWRTFYNIKDGRLVGKLHAVGRGPGEYSQINSCTYLPADSLYYGYSTQGQIMCYKTPSFKFVSKFETDFFIYDMFAISRNQLLLSAILLPKDDRNQYSREEVVSGVFLFDGDSLTKVIDIYGDQNMSPIYSLSGDDVLISVKQEDFTINLCRYSNGQITKVATIDYGDMEISNGKEIVDSDEEGNRYFSFKDHAVGCKFAQLYGSTLAYWHFPQVNNRRWCYLTIATRDKVQNYKVHIGGLKIDASADMVDNGVYTMLIQSDWQSIIDTKEKLSKTGERIIEALKGNDYNPVILQFKLKL